MSVPKLRFKEFNNNWKLMELREVTDIQGGGTPSTSVEEFWNGDIEWFTPTEIGNMKYVSESKRKITSEGLSKSSAKLLPIGTILLTTRASLGDMAISLKEVTTNQGFQSLICKKDILNEFLYYQQPKIQKHCYTLASGSTFLEISKQNLGQCIIGIPNSYEQSKLARFFSLIDEKIQKQQEKVELLKVQKNGLLQKIFNQELLFKDENGQNYSKWEKTVLGNVVEVVGGGTPSTSTEDYWNGEIQWFTPTEISEKKHVSESRRTISEKGLKSSSAKLLPKGTVLLTTRATLGEMAILLNEATTNQGFQSLVPKDITTTDFIYYLQPQIRKYCYTNASGSTFLEISKKALMKMPLMLPCKSEQIRISNFLSDFDYKIELEQEKFKKLTEQKKALIQQMFI